MTMAVFKISLHKHLGNIVHKCMHTETAQQESLSSYGRMQGR